MTLFHDGHRSLQDRYDTRRLADRLDDVLNTDVLDHGAAAMIESADHFFLATVSPDGMPTVGYKGGDPGFVRVLDERTLAFPNYNGNGMYLGMGNVLGNGQLGMLFVDWVKGHRLRVHGTATIDFDDPLTATYPEAQFVVRVTTTAVFPNCPRYVHRMQPVERSVFVPREGRRTPVPSWKRADWASDVLPDGDPASDPDAPVV
jgi:predicted pyridoxine 5'-phosphate oxidase superfamily flavin-nucleotide-binding protein